MWILVLLTVISVTAAAWLLQAWLARRYVQAWHVFDTQARQTLREVFLFLDPAQVWMAGWLLSALTTGTVYVLTTSPIAASAVGAAALMAPRYTMMRLRRLRLNRIDEQLPDFLLALAGALRAGSGMQSALQQIAATSTQPLSQELGLMLREQRMGISLDEALANLYRRVPTEGSSLVVSALRISAQSGGSLAEALERIAAMLRARLHLLGRIRALTSQGRMQVWVMALLPLGLATVLHWLDPDTMSRLWTTPAGWATMGCVLLLEVTGIYLVRRIVAIRV